MKLNFLKKLITIMVGCMVMAKLPTFSFDTEFRYMVPAAEKPVVNPLKGFAPWISSEETKVPVSMVFVRMKWSEIEPEEGVYCFQQFEEKNHMKEWREKGVRFLIRLVCDTPSEESHMDIPQWLYEKTYGDGDWYDSSYGKGYSPNYANPVFIEAHEKLLRAFADYYGDDLQLGFVQLGSLGHWGEWHVNSDAGIRQFPKGTVYNKYVQAYLDVFPASKLLVRRPLNIAGEAGMGLYNDSFGKVSAHRTWLSWIAEGYFSDQSEEQLFGMPDFWQTAPSGGELATSYDEVYFFSEGFEATMELLKESHTTFLGPRSGAYVEDESCKENVLTMSRELGYCFQLSEVVLRKAWWNPKYMLQIDIENIGVAPFYENWPLEVFIFNEEGELVLTREQDINLPSLLPGKHRIRIIIEGLDGLAAGKYKIAAGIRDPLTGKPGVAFANVKNTETDNLYKVMEFTIKK